jgi:hypothetical protein
MWKEELKTGGEAWINMCVLVELVAHRHLIGSSSPSISLPNLSLRLGSDIFLLVLARKYLREPGLFLV